MAFGCYSCQPEVVEVLVWGAGLHRIGDLSGLSRGHGLRGLCYIGGVIPDDVLEQAVASLLSVNP